MILGSATAMRRPGRVSWSRMQPAAGKA